MAQETLADDRSSAVEPDVYLPVGFTPPFEASRLERIWATLFDHGVGPRK